MWPKWGRLLLLFSLGIEISLEGLWELRREFLIGGLVQTLLAAIPATLASYLGGASWGAALVIGIAVANSSTVMVFKALEEWGQVGTPLGRRTLAILLFGDIVLVPVLLFVPFLTESGGPPGWRTLVILGAQAALLVIAVPLAAPDRWPHCPGTPLAASQPGIDGFVLCGDLWYRVRGCRERGASSGHRGACCRADFRRQPLESPD